MPNPSTAIAGKALLRNVMCFGSVFESIEIWSNGAKSAPVIGTGALKVPPKSVDDAMRIESGKPSPPGTYTWRQTTYILPVLGLTAIAVPWFCL